MASGGDDLVAKFKEFCTLAGSKDPTQMTSKASGKLVADCLEKDYKKYDIKSICDASVFPAVKEKGKPFMVVNKTTVDDFITRTAHEITKKKSKNARIAKDDAAVTETKTAISSAICGGGPKVKATEISKTGNVAGMTDASNYTGSHKERFGADGKGKGIEGRADRADNSGYVGNYKGSGTYEKK